jgi:peptidoglycan/xylan/chitin deacetylase (PgdA/CDA1 family)
MNQTERLARRAEQARAARRRRRAAGLGLLAVAALIVAAVVLLGSGGGDNGSARPAASSGAPGSRSTSGGGEAPKAKPSSLLGPIPANAPGAHRAPTEPVPILMYHVIGTVKPGTPFPELWVTAADFSAEMHALADHGYHGVTLQQAYDAWHHGGLLPAKPVVVSFDDGYSGQYKDAMPVLRSLRWPGVLNLKLGNLRDLKAAHVLEMIANGWEVDSHTINHPSLPAIDDAHLRYELEASKARLKKDFGLTVNFFCYPAGAYDQRVVAAVRRAGYLAATTTDEGYARPQDTFVLGRVRVNGSDSPSSLLAKLKATDPNAAPTLRPQGGA